MSNLKKLFLITVLVVLTNSTFAAAAHALGCDTEPAQFESGLPTGWLTGIQTSENPEFEGANENIRWSTNNDALFCNAENYASKGGKSLCVSSDNAFGREVPAIGYKTYLHSNEFNTKNVDRMIVQFDLNYQNFDDTERFEFKLRSTNDDGSYTWHVVETYRADIGEWFKPNTGLTQSVVISDTTKLLDADTRIGWVYIDESGTDADWYAQIDNVSIVCESDNLVVSSDSREEVDATAVSVSSVETNLDGFIVEMSFWLLVAVTAVTIAIGMKHKFSKIP